MTVSKAVPMLFGASLPMTFAMPNADRCDHPAEWKAIPEEQDKWRSFALVSVLAHPIEPCMEDTRRDCARGLFLDRQVAFRWHPGSAMDEASWRPFSNNIVTDAGRLNLLCAACSTWRAENLAPVAKARRLVPGWHCCRPRTAGTSEASRRDQPVGQERGDRARQSHRRFREAWRHAGFNHSGDGDGQAIERARGAGHFASNRTGICRAIFPTRRDFGGTGMPGSASCWPS